jgi:hypothetical protein
MRAFARKSNLAKFINYIKFMLRKRSNAPPECQKSILRESIRGEEVFS